MWGHRPNSVYHQFHCPVQYKQRMNHPLFQEINQMTGHGVKWKRWACHLLRRSQSHSRVLSGTSGKTTSLTFRFCFFKILSVRNNKCFVFPELQTSSLSVSPSWWLFTICPACCGETHGNVEQQQGTFVQIKQVRGYCTHIKVKMCANLYLYCIYCVFFVLSFLLYQFTFLTV